MTLLATERLGTLLSGLDWKQILLDRLADLTGRDFRLFDADGHVVAATPVTAPVCQRVHASPAGRGACEGCLGDAVAPHPAGGPHIICCPGQMAHLVTPVYIGGRFMGHLAWGAIGWKGTTKAPGAELCRLADHIGVPAEELLEAHRQAPCFSREKLEQALDVLHGMLSHKTAEMFLAEPIDEVRSLAKRVNVSEFWPAVNEAIRRVVPAEEVEIFTVAPARDAFARVWPDAEGETAPSRKELDRAEAAGFARGDAGESLVLVRSDEQLLAVLRVRPPLGRPHGGVDFAFLGELARATAEVLLVIRRRQKEEILAELDRRFAAVPHPQARLEIILSECIRLLGCDNGDVLLCRYDHPEYLREVARHGPDIDVLPGPVHADGITRRVLHDRLPAVVTRAGTDEDHRRLIQQVCERRAHYREVEWVPYWAFVQKIAACVKLPLLADNDVVGVIRLQRATEGPFDLDRVHACEALAERAAGEAAKLLFLERYSRQRRGRDPAEGPEELAARVASLAPAEAHRRLCQELADRARQESGAYRVAVRMISPDWRTLGVSAVSEVRPGLYPEQFIAIPISLEEDSAAGRAIRTGQTYLIDDTRRRDIHYKQIDEALPQHSHAAVLLRSGGHVLGVLSVCWDAAGACDRDMIDVLEHLAERYAAAIKNHDQAHLLAKLDDTLARLAASGSGEPDYEDFLRTVAQMIGTAHGSVFLRDARTGRYHLKAHQSHSEWVNDLGKCYAADPADGVTGWVLAHNRPLNLGRLNDPDELQAVAPDLAWKNRVTDFPGENDGKYPFLVVPISVGDEVLGVLRLASSSKQRFHSNDAQIAAAVAARLAGYLYQRQQAERTSVLIQLRSRILLLRSRQELAGTVFEALAAVFGEQFGCHIRVFDELQEGAGPVGRVLLHLAQSDPGHVDMPRFRRSGEGIAGWVWEHNCRFLDQVVSAPDSPCQTQPLRGELGEDYFRKVGCCACVPVPAADGSLAGTLFVRRPQRRSLSPGDIAFIEEVSKVVGLGLDAIREREAEHLELELGRVVDRYLVGLLNRQDARVQEQALFLAVLNTLLRGLGLLHGPGATERRLGWVGILDEAGSHLRVIDALGRPANHVSPVPAEHIREVLGAEGFRVLVRPEQDTGVALLIRKCANDHPEVFEGVQVGLLALEVGGRPLALFCILVRPPEAISRLRAARARDLLLDVARLVVIGREFADHVRELEVARPLALLGSMFSDFEHDTRAPVTNLKGYIEFLTNRPRTLDQVNSRLPLMKKERDRLEAILRQLIDLVALSRSEFAPVDLAAVLRAALQEVSPDGGGVRAELDGPPEPVTVHGIAEYLRRAFKAVLTNAFQAAASRGEAGVVRVAIRHSGGCCTVVVEDNGLGMDEASARRALEPFYTTKQPSGTGLGLPAAYTIIKSHDGDLLLESRLGEGTRVTVSLPLFKGGTR